MIQAILEWYDDVLENKSDPRVNNWPMMSSPFPTIFLVFSYVMFVTKIGPYLMRNRKPFKMNNILIIYNAIQVVISTWIFYEGSVSGWLTFYSFRCQPIDYSNNPLAVRMAAACWWYFMSKFTEFLDTIFFVLRKKNSHISNLHVIHHSIMPFSCWFGVKFFPGGQPSFFGLLNTFVHIIMYTYYMLAAMGPRVQPYLWWKKYLTILQIVQFMLVIIHSLQTLFIDCDLPKGLNYYIIAHAIMFIVLFGNFYSQSYTNKTVQAESTNDVKKSTSEYSFTKENNLRKRMVS